MIEPTGMPVDVLGLKNPQTKVLGNQGVKGQRQTMQYDAGERGQDNKGIAALGTGAVGDDVPGNTVREMQRSTSGKQGQDAGSVQSSVQSSGTERVNKGAAETSGHTPIGGPLAVTQQKGYGVKADPGTVVPPIFGKPDSVLQQGEGVAISS